VAQRVAQVRDQEVLGLHRRLLTRRPPVQLLDQRIEERDVSGLLNSISPRSMRRRLVRPLSFDVSESSLSERRTGTFMTSTYARSALIRDLALTAV
jgi:hypothetical protein